MSRYTGQYNDALTGLDYYNARYYDPTVGVFLSADTVQGNGQGMNPYAYVGGNPETNSDPTGQMMCSDTCHCGGGSDPTPPSPPSTPTTGGTGTPAPTMQECRIANVCAGRSRPPLTRSDLLAMCAVNPDCHRWEFNQSLVQTGQFLFQVGFFLGNLYDGLSEAQLVMDVVASEGEGDTSVEMEAAALQEDQAMANQLEKEGVINEEEAAGACSFTPNTPVMTNQGEHPIGKLYVGEKVLAYDPKTGKMEFEPVLHVWIHQDNDLVDLIITTTSHAPHSATSIKKTEVLHTNKKHPFYTLEKGFIPVSQLHLGMHLLSADGYIGAVTGWKLVPGVKAMYNLTVAHDHTYTVGIGQWVVHNTDPGCSDGFIAANFQSGAKQIQSDYNLGSPYYDTSVDPGKWKFIDVTEGGYNNDPRLVKEGFIARYYFQFQTAQGVVRVSADFNPETGDWNDSVANGFHLSSTQESSYWQSEAENQ